MRRMVLVEDEPILARTFIRIFSTRGYEITHITNVAEATEYLRTQTYDVVLLDRQVIGGDGWELACHSRSKVVLMTGNPPPGNTLPFFFKGLEDIQQLIKMVEE